MSAQETPAQDAPDEGGFEPASLTLTEIRARVFEATGHSIDFDDPVMIWQIILGASLEDQQRLILQMRRELGREIEHMLTEIRDRIGSAAIQERIAAMSAQIDRANRLERSLARNVWLFRLFTFVNLASLSAAAAIFHIISR